MRKSAALALALAFAGIISAQQAQSAVLRDNIPPVVPKTTRSGADKIGKNASR